MTRGEYVEKVAAKLQTLFPDGTDDAEKKRGEVLAYAAEETLGPPGLRDLDARNVNARDAGGYGLEGATAFEGVSIAIN